MNFLDRIFNKNKIDCPRCLGKGVVNAEDIKRLKKEIYWMPGECAYCNGTGKVAAETVTLVDAGNEYLTTDLSASERKKLFNGDMAALQRAKEYTAAINEMVKEIEHMYYIQNLEAVQIADYFLKRYTRPDRSLLDLQETIEYIEKVISSKRTNP